MASPTSTSASPLPYISAVSIRFMPMIEAAAQRGDLRVRGEPGTLAEAPGALAEHRDLVSGWQA